MLSVLTVHYSSINAHVHLSLHFQSQPVAVFGLFSHPHIAGRSVPITLSGAERPATAVLRRRALSDTSNVLDGYLVLITR